MGCGPKCDGLLSCPFKGDSLTLCKCTDELFVYKSVRPLQKCGAFSFSEVTFDYICKKISCGLAEYAFKFDTLLSPCMISQTRNNTTLPMNSYFYLDSDNKQHGPVVVEKLIECGVTRTSLVWCNGMADWAPADSVDEIRTWFDDHQESAPASSDSGAGANQQEQWRGAQQPQYGQAAGNAYQQNYCQQAGYSGQGCYGNPGNPYGYMPCPPTYLVWAILSTICCCLPLGIVAIVKSTHVTKFYNRGMYDQALIASAEAKAWCIYSLVGYLLSQFIGWGTFALSDWL